MAKFTIVDLETTGNAPARGDRIIEVGIIVWEDGEVIEEFESFVYPEQQIPAFITNLTGIADDHVANAPLFSEIAEDVRELFEDAYIVAHNIQFDLGFLNFELQHNQLKPLDNPVIDTVELARILLPQSSSFKLGQLAEQLSLDHTDPHRALSDTRVTAELLEHLFKKLNSLPAETIEQLLSLEGNLKSDLRQILMDEWNRKTFSSDRRKDIKLVHGLAVKSIDIPDSSQVKPELSFGEHLDFVFHSKKGLASFMDSYEYREAQRTMAETIFDAFSSTRHALIEAETGTGKSLAYLLPAVHHAMSDDEPVVISTYTTQLQRQLLEKEIPQVERLYNVAIRVAILKGKEHYLSLLRFSKELKERNHDNYDTALAKAMLVVWITETETGDIDEVQLPSSGRILWNRISSNQEEAQETWAKENQYSYYRIARGRSEHAHIVITNHSLLCTDLTFDHQLIPSYNYAVIDEAHHLEPTASKHFGLKMDYIDWQNNLSQLEALMKLHDTTILKNGDDIDRLLQLVSNAKEEVDTLFRALFRMVKNKVRSSEKSDVGRLQVNFAATNVKRTLLAKLEEMTHRLQASLNAIQRSFVRLDSQEGGESELQSHSEHLSSMCFQLRDFLTEVEVDQVKWIEIDANGAQNSAYLFSEPVDISNLIKASLFDKKKSVILTSATLTMKHSFHYISDRLGLPKEETIRSKIPSPFPFEEQVQLMVPNDFPDINEEPDEFIYATCEAIYSLANVTNGRMLVLFTSYDMLKKSHDLLKDLIMPEEFMIFAQGISSGSRERLKKNFQAFDQAILLGTSSFWEGVDIPGDDLSCLMIVRLPFQPPNHPVYQARAKRLKEEKRNAFMELSLPHAVLRFKQGFGRLIRSSTDRGIVFVCDQRIIKARYGKYFIESIPEVPLKVDSTASLIENVSEWL
ncbi:ATP-dependent DNA helicase DinG [Thalassobacillus hwangdonensis]|uniref:3'-5' exonuclease DinG n=1 Tax=Thalassobacillus hwangdonensis TaxID=546108 RepID=A0ABW3KZY0_9BACI